MKMTWEEAIKINPVGPTEPPQPFPTSNCEVSICNATRCFWNRNRKCRLREVTVNDTGQCVQYKEN